MGVVDYLEPTSPVMALTWMTAVDQCLGVVRRHDVWRIRWVRVDPLARSAGILVTTHEEDLVGGAGVRDHLGVPELDPALPLPEDLVAQDERDALLRAERETGARLDRWVNPSVDGWRALCELRGHA